jgi:hypothetical protein
MGKIDPGFSRQDDLQPLLEHVFFLQLPDEGHPFFSSLEQSNGLSGDRAGAPWGEWGMPGNCP